MRCPDCGYDLRGLPSGQCPECGRAFDPSDPASYLGRPLSGRTLLVEAVVAIVLLLGVLLLGWLADRGLPVIESFYWFWVIAGPFSLIMSFVIACSVALSSVRALRGTPPWFVHRRSLIAALVLASLLLVVFLVAFLVPLMIQVWWG
jgi:hypothetical protein